MKYRCVMSRMNEQSQQEEEQQNLSGAFDYEEYLSKKFDEDFAEFVASHEKDDKELQRIAESAQPVAATQQGK